MVEHCAGASANSGAKLLCARKFITGELASGYISSVYQFYGPNNPTI
jgi:hypothetical protein